MLFRVRVRALSDSYCVKVCLFPRFKRGQHDYLIAGRDCKYRVEHKSVIVDLNFIRAIYSYKRNYPSFVLFNISFDKD